MGGVNEQCSFLSSIPITELSLSKAPNLPGCYSKNGYPLLRECVFNTHCCVCVCVCVYLDELNAEHKF